MNKNLILNNYKQKIKIYLNKHKYFFFNLKKKKKLFNNKGKRKLYYLI